MICLLHVCAIEDVCLKPKKKLEIGYLSAIFLQNMIIVRFINSILMFIQNNMHDLIKKNYSVYRAAVTLIKCQYVESNRQVFTSFAFDICFISESNFASF